MNCSWLHLIYVNVDFLNVHFPAIRFLKGRRNSFLYECFYICVYIYVEGCTYVFPQDNVSTYIHTYVSSITSGLVLNAFGKVQATREEKKRVDIAFRISMEKRCFLPSVYLICVFFFFAPHFQSILRSKIYKQ